MEKVTKFVTTAGITLAIATSALAAPAKTAAKAGGKTAANPTCPVCKMSLSSKKTKANTVAVKIKGKTYYCCAKCKMPKPGKAKKA